MVALYKAPPGTAPPSLRVREGMCPAQDPTARLCAWGDPRSLCSELSVPVCTG